MTEEHRLRIPIISFDPRFDRLIHRSSLSPIDGARNVTVSVPSLGCEEEGEEVAGSTPRATSPCASVRTLRSQSRRYQLLPHEIGDWLLSHGGYLREKLHLCWTASNGQSGPQVLVVRGVVIKVSFARRFAVSHKLCYQKPCQTKSGLRKQVPRIVPKRGANTYTNVHLNGQNKRSYSYLQLLWQASRGGLEPPQQDPESCVLPLHNREIRRNYTLPATEVSRKASSFVQFVR